MLSKRFQCQICIYYIKKLQKNNFTILHFRCFSGVLFLVNSNTLFDSILFKIKQKLVEITNLNYVYYTIYISNRLFIYKQSALTNMVKIDLHYR